MQKTVVFGRKQVLQENISPKFVHRSKCQNCEKLQKQLAELSLFSAQAQPSLDPETAPDTQVIQQELLELRQQFINLKKKLFDFERENDDLYDENNKLNRQLKACRIELREVLKRKKQPLLLESQSEYMESEEENSAQADAASREKQLKDSERDTRSQKALAQLQQQHEKALKQMEISMFVWREKTQSLQAVNRLQNEEIAKLKDLLRRRNRLQEKRHVILEGLCC